MQCFMFYATIQLVDILYIIVLVLLFSPNFLKPDDSVLFLDTLQEELSSVKAGNTMPSTKGLREIVSIVI